MQFSLRKFLIKHFCIVDSKFIVWHHCHLNFYIWIFLQTRVSFYIILKFLLRRKNSLDIFSFEATFETFKVYPLLGSWMYYSCHNILGSWRKEAGKKCQRPKEFQWDNSMRGYYCSLGTKSPKLALHATFPSTWQNYSQQWCWSRCLISVSLNLKRHFLHFISKWLKHKESPGFNHRFNFKLPFSCVMQLKHGVFEKWIDNEYYHLTNGVSSKVTSGHWAIDNKRM